MTTHHLLPSGYWDSASAKRKMTLHRCKNNHYGIVKVCKLNLRLRGGSDGGGRIVLEALAVTLANGVELNLPPIEVTEPISYMY